MLASYIARHKYSYWTRRDKTWYCAAERAARSPANVRTRAATKAPVLAIASAAAANMLHSYLQAVYNQETFN